jgi:uncharacterized protein (DUF433 family)
MSVTIQPEAPPLRVDESGAIRVGNTRVLLELVLRAFQRGASPEQIVEMYDALSLADVYGTIGYYLRHRTEVDTYLEEQERKGEELRLWFEARQGSSAGLRERLLARQKQQTESHGGNGSAETGGQTSPHSEMTQ